MTDYRITDWGYNYRYSRKVMFPIIILADVTNESIAYNDIEAIHRTPAVCTTRWIQESTPAPTILSS